MTAIRKKSSFRVGDRVRLGYGPRKFTGEIVEDRGAIGVGGRRLFAVSVPDDPFDDTVTEVPEDELEAVTDEPKTLEKSKIIEFLSFGGLLSILRNNLVGGKHQPRAWLLPNQLGNVTYTLFPGRGVIGGESVPFRALNGDKIFASKRDETIAFVESFGLTRDEAEKVVSKVGTSR